jgi:hypothetical protein
MRLLQQPDALNLPAQKSALPLYIKFWHFSCQQLEFSLRFQSGIASWARIAAFQKSAAPQFPVMECQMGCQVEGKLLQ